jgi:hypothetical protein
MQTADTRKSHPTHTDLPSGSQAAHSTQQLFAAPSLQGTPSRKPPSPHAPKKNPPPPKSGKYRSNSSGDLKTNQKTTLPVSRLVSITPTQSATHTHTQPSCSASSLTHHAPSPQGGLARLGWVGLDSWAPAPRRAAANNQPAKGALPSCPFRRSGQQSHGISHAYNAISQSVLQAGGWDCETLDLPPPSADVCRLEGRTPGFTQLVRRRLTAGAVKL